MSLPSCSAGPDSATDCPRTICVSLTPCAPAKVAARAASAVRMTRFMTPPGSCVTPQDDSAGSAGEEVSYLVHEALGARVVARAVALVDLLELLEEVLLAVGEAYRGLH